MSRVSAHAALAAAALAAAAPASAAPRPDDSPAQPAPPAAPDAARVRRAAEAFDAGVAAFKDKRYELAASRFEEADAAVPSPQALRQAIRARHQAGQGARAATHAAQALQRYPGDPPTVELAEDTIDQLEPVLHKVSVTCASPCVLAAGTRAIPGEAAARWVIYLDPQPATVSASFLSGGSRQSLVEGKPGGSTELHFDPAADPGAAPAPGPAPEPAPEPAPGPAPEPAPGPAPEPDTAPDTAAAKGSGLPVFVFLGGVAATAALGGVTIWSGVDTLNNPGPDAVRAACAGRGPSCPLYQDGLAKETRTNVLIGATAGAGALTLLAAVFTDWGGGSTAEGSANAAPRPTLTAFTDGRGAILGARGTF
jgi:hypothetical protein